MKYFFICFPVLFPAFAFSQEFLTVIGISKFKKPAENPILRADSSFQFLDPVSKKWVRWQAADVFNPAAIVKDGRVYLLYRCEDKPAAAIGGRSSRIGLAESSDGIHFKKFQKPVLYPGGDSWMQYDYPGGCEDPRIVQTSDGRFVMTYTSWNGRTARLSIAFSNDLIHWQKLGPAFAKANEGRFRDIWSKSGSIITSLERGRCIALKINGKYWMYWGEQFVNLAWSINLKDWYPLTDPDGNLKRIAETRPGRFDSELTECGPPALMTSKGVILLYNGKNAENEKTSCPYLPKGTYSVGAMLFDAADPSRLLERTDTCILKPTLPHELTGQYQAGTIFSEGLVYFHGRYFLYYGMADSFVGVAIAP